MHPMITDNIEYWLQINHRLYCQQAIFDYIVDKIKHRLLPSAAIRDYLKGEQLDDFAYSNSQTRLVEER
jgi:hypothetical protein